MSLADALNAKKEGLKVTETIVKTSADVEDKEEEKKKQEEMKKYVETWSAVNIEEWVDLLGDLTFPTRTIPLTKHQASLFVNHWNIMNDILMLPEVRLARKDDIRKQLGDLEKQIESSIQDLGGTAFVKTSSRSPKDTTQFGQRLDHRIRELLSSTPLPDLYHQNLDDSSSDDDALPGDEKKILDEVTRISRCLMQANFDVMKMTDAKLALDLLLHSHRIFEDMNEALEYGVKFNQSIIVRKWEDIEWQFEVRGFVHNNQLTGLSQYPHPLYLPEVYSRRHHLKQVIVSFWETHVKSKLEKFQSYVIDFAVFGEDYQKVLVIELNPFHETTNGTLYRWGYDRKELENGPLNFRVRGGHYKNGLKLLTKNHEEYFPQEFLKE